MCIRESNNREFGLSSQLPTPVVIQTLFSSIGRVDNILELMSKWRAIDVVSLLDDE